MKVAAGRATRVRYGLVPTAFGELLVATTERGVCYIDLNVGPDARASVTRLEQWALRRLTRPELQADGDAASEHARQLVEYAAGGRRRFELPLDLVGTDFERSVWRELRRIGYGETTTYGEVARRLGSPGASRAVGGANGSNPVPIVVPCHRVLAAGGALGGFSAGLAWKRRLLALEGTLLLG